MIQIELLTLMIGNKLTLVSFLGGFLERYFAFVCTSYVTSNMLFFKIVAIHTMLKYWEQVVKAIGANDEESKEIGSRVTNFKEITKRMRMKYDKYYNAPENMNLLVYIAPIFDARCKFAGLDVSLYDLFGEA